MKKKLCVAAIVGLFLVAVYFVYNFYASIPAFSDKIPMKGKAEEQSDVLSAPRSLIAGTYQLTLRYSSTTKNAVLYCIDALTADEENHYPAQLATMELPKTADGTIGVHTVTITLPDDTRDFSVGICCADGYVEVQELTCKSVAVPHGYRDAYFVAAVLVAAGLIVAWICRRASKRRELCVDSERLLTPEMTVALIGVIVVAASWPFLTNYITNGHDAAFHISRIDGMVEGLRNGQFPVRMDYASSTIGYVSPIMYPNLLFYFPAVLRLCGVSLVTSYVAYVFLITLLTAAIAYYAMTRISRSQFAGMAFSAVYTMGLYRLVCIGVRTAVGEYTAMTFLPLIAVGLYELVFEEDCRIWPLIIGITGTLQSHVLSTAIAGIAGILFLLVNIRRLCCKKKLFALLWAAVITLLVNLWFIVPMLSMMRTEMVSTSTPETNRLFQNAGLYLPQLFTSFVSPFGYGTDGVPNGAAHQASLSIGLLPGLGLLAWLLFQLLQSGGKADRSRRLHQIGWGSFAAAIIALALCTVYFSHGTLFDHYALSVMQFPWRFLAFALLFAAMTTAVLVGQLWEGADKKHARVALLCILMVCILNMAPFSDAYTKEAEILCYGKNENPAHCADIMYRYYDSIPSMRKGKELIVDDSVRIANYQANNINLSFDFERTDDAHTSVEIGLPRYCYPGYVALLDGVTPLVLAEDKYYCWAVEIPEDVQTGNVLVTYRGEAFYRIGDYISMATLLACGGYAVYRIRKNARRHREKATL